MKLSEINIRDPFIHTHNNKYYLFGSSGWNDTDGFFCSVSEDMIEWSKPAKCFEPPDGFWGTANFWAPEVHEYKGRFYMFASFYATGHMRATQILAADRPEGPYTIWSCPITPGHWMCLDGTLYVEDGAPYMVFCHEWTQVQDGEMCAVKLSDDLKQPIGEPLLLFRASEPVWAKKNRENNVFISDGPFLHRTKDGRLIMIWSSFDKCGNYIEAVAESSNGLINGKWSHCQNLIFDKNGGHGMLFNDISGNLCFTMHTPNHPSGAERAVIYKVEEIPNDPYIVIKR